MSERRPFALLRSGDQWLRCGHEATFVDLAAGVVELAWTTSTAESDAAAPTLGAGLVFDAHCRLLHSLPAAGRVERVLWAAINLAAPAASQPTPLDLFEAPSEVAVGDFQVSTPATPLIEPRGLAVDAEQRLFVAETGADNILVYDLWDQRLVQRIGLPSGARPTDLAALGWRVYAVLSGTGGLISLGARGAVQPVALPAGCEQPSRVALSPAGKLAVLARAGTAEAYIGFADPSYSGFDVPMATDIEWESEQVLVVARQPEADFLRQHVAPGTSERLPPLRARAYDGLGIVVVPPLGPLGESTRRMGYWTSRGLRVAVAARLVYARRGRLTTYRLDSGAYQTEWGRVFIDACIPEGASLGLQAIALDEADDEPTLQRVPPANITQASVRRPDLSPPMPPAARVPAPDASSDARADVTWQALHRRDDVAGNSRELPWTEPTRDDRFVTYEAPVIASPGRYLWLTLDLRGNTRVSPKLRCVRAEHPTHDYLRRLPRAFSRDPAGAAFLQRYLALFEGFLGDTEARAVERDLLLAPRSAPEALLPWLASLLGLVLDDRWASAPMPQGQALADVRRQYIEEAAWLFRYRGTVPGLKRFIEIYAGVPVHIIEHYQLRGWGAAVLGDTGTAQSSSVVGFGMRVGGELASEVGLPVSGTQGNEGPLPSFLDPLGGPDAKRQVWGRSVADAFRSHAHRFTVIIPAALSAEQLAVVQNILQVHRPAHTVFEICSVDAGMRVGQGLLLELTSVIGRSAGFSRLQLGASALGRGAVVGPPRIGARLGSAELGRSSTVA